MWNQVLPPAHLEQSILPFVREAPKSFVQLMRLLPQMRGTADFTVSAGFILWSGLSPEAVAALDSLHRQQAIFFWLCSPAVYARTNDAPFLRLARGARGIGEPPWLPTLILDRPPTAKEARAAVKEYVAEIAQYSMPRV